MAGYLPGKMKRKDLEEVNDDFSDFSLSSPARKIRRLDAELPPIMEEEEPFDIPLFFEQPSTQHIASSTQQLGAAMADALPSVPLNEERALVLYKPVSSPLLRSSSSSDFSFTVNSDLIPGFRNKIFWSGHTILGTVEDEAADTSKNTGMMNDCLAVVPWVPSPLPPDSGTVPPVTGLSEQMEAEATMMDIEDDNVQVIEDEARETGGVGGGEALQQWQQQHCMTPQLPQNRSNPIMWSW